MSCESVLVENLFFSYSLEPASANGIVWWIT